MHPRKVEIEVQKTFEILLDIEKDLYTPSNLLFNVSRNDFESIDLLFTIVQDEAALDLTGATVELAIKKPSGLTVYQPVEITDAAEGKAAARLSIQAYVEFGIHSAEVHVRNETQMMVTNTFYFYSREAIMQIDEIESVNDWSALQQALFELDKKPKLVDGVPTFIPDYVGQMAFDIVGKRAFIANDLILEGWQLFAAGEGGGGGIVYWKDIIGKPAVFPPEIHTHDFVDIQGKPALYPPEAHNHAILDVNGLQAALDAKANTGELGAPVDHTHAIADVTGLQTTLDAKADDVDLAALEVIVDSKANAAHNHTIADVTGLQAALDAKADDADLIPFITTTEADAKYAIKGDAGGTIAAAWGDIAGTLANQTDLQAALDGKADDVDLAGKANTVHTHTIANVTGLQTALDGKADDADLAGKANTVHNHIIADVTGLQAAIDGKADVVHDHAILDVTGLQAALDGKADDADLAGKADAADLATKADAADLTAKANTVDVYPKTQIYTKTEVDAIVTGITEGGGTIVQDNLTSTSTSAALSANQGRVLNETKADAADLAGKANTVHSHAIADVTGLQAGLDGKANTVHSHAIADVTGLQAGLDGKANTAHNHTIANVTGLQAALDGKADDADLAGKANTVHNHAIADVTNLQTTLDGKANAADLTAKANTVDVYPKTQTYTKTEVDTALTGKANAADLAAKANTADLAAKANTADVYLKTETYNKTEVDTDLAAKSDVGHTHNFLDLANQPDAYTPTAHQHPISDITNLQTTLDAKADDADLAAFITEAAADLKYEAKGAGATNWGEITGTLSAQADLQTALDGKADDADLAGKADVVHTHTFAEITAKPTTFTPPLASGLVVGGHRVGNGLAMAGEYLTVKSGNGLKTDSATSYAVEIDKTVTDGWYATTSQMGGLTLWQGTQSAYDALTKDPSTLYFITGA